MPSDDDIARLDERFPGTVVELTVEPGDRLAELPNQGTSRYELGLFYLGATSRPELEECYEDCSRRCRSSSMRSRSRASDGETPTQHFE